MFPRFGLGSLDRMTVKSIGSSVSSGGLYLNVTLDTPREELTVHLERAVLVSVALPERPWIGDDPLDELRGLATTAGAVVVGGLTPETRQDINPGTYIGKGKLAGAARAGPGHRRRRRHLRQRPVARPRSATWRRPPSVKVLDRSELILDIFATRARTIEARLQVELAQLEYSLPRLRQMWTPPGAHQGRHRHCAAPAKRSWKKTAGSSTCASAT